MILDSHAHYSHPIYDGERKYVIRTAQGYSCAHGDRASMFEAMRNGGIAGFIEPSVSVARLELQLEIADQYALYPAVGVHPKHCHEAPWAQREQLEAYAQNAVAIGETGLDYHHLPPDDCQKMWFDYQIGLADKFSLPLILHIREAHADALDILRQRKTQLHGGVAHCFTEGEKIAMEYVELGFAIGIGGKLLMPEFREKLTEVVRQVPRAALLLETDAPYLRPRLPHDCSKSQWSRSANTSLSLYAVAEEIARIKGLEAETVENVIFENTLRVFRLPKDRFSPA